MSTFKLTIVTPEREIFSQDVTTFICESQKGQFQILPKYEKSIVVVVPNAATIKDENGKMSKLFVSSGLLKVKEDEVMLCVDAAEWPQDIDVNRAEAAKERAQKRISNKDKDTDVKRAEVALVRALARIETVEAKIPQ